MGPGDSGPGCEPHSRAAKRIPVVAYCRSERGVILNATYGYRGSEQDLRATGIIPAGFLSPQAARMKLLACLASGLSIDEIEAQHEEADALNRFYDGAFRVFKGIESDILAVGAGQRRADL
mgnify:CR=1 FL=1